MKALVIGAALSGIAVSKLLSSKGYEVYLTDAREISSKSELERLGIRVYDMGHPDLLKEIEYDIIVKNPGIKYSVPFVKYFKDKGYKLLNEIEVASSYVRYNYGAITGTNGKTTTTTLLGEFLKTKNTNNGPAGNIGLPLSDIVMNHPCEELDIAVEIAAFQLLGCEKFHPVVSVCMNLTPDHVDYFGDVDAYYEAKMLVYKNQRDDDWFLLNVDDDNVVRFAKDIKCQTVTFSLKKDADLMVKDGTVTLFNEKLFDVKELKLPGRHNLQNTMVAAAMAKRMGVKSSDIENVIRGFNGVKHRLEFIEEIDGVRYYNDSKGTNPDSTMVALEAFDDNVILLAGGYDKKTGFDSIKPYLHHVKKMMVFGATKYQIKELYPDAIVCDTMAEAIDIAHKEAVSGDVVLLSPMCASWDQFNNFEERGDQFASIVRELKS